MKSLRSILAVLFTGASATAGEPAKASPKAPAEAMREMRLQWLTRKPVADHSGPSEPVSAVVMDWPIEQATVTVLASSVGDASVYTTGTFGIIGGIGHENARKAALEFIQCATKYLRLGIPTTDFSYPDSGHVKFFFVTSLGVRSVSFTTAEVQKVGTDACDLYAHGQLVLTEMRKISGIK